MFREVQLDGNYMRFVLCAAAPFTWALAGGFGDGERLGLRSADRRGILGPGLLGSGFDDPAFG